MYIRQVCRQISAFTGCSHIASGLECDQASRSLGDHQRLASSLSKNGGATDTARKMEKESSEPPNKVRLLMVGDVMLGRGVDQILPHQNDPTLYEGYVTDAREYVELAVRRNGPLPTPRDPSYIWGDALEIMNELNPAVRLINLETSITSTNHPDPRKGMHYRMHPENIGVIKAADINCVGIANNHVLDWSQQGLCETLATLHAAQLPFVGAGSNQAEAEKPAVYTVDGCDNKVLVFAAAHNSSGVPGSWAATDHRPGVNLVDFSRKSVKKIADLVRTHKRPGDLAVFSIHWGPNWAWEVEKSHADFAHHLINDANIDVIHGHSSHHVKGLEVYRGKLIIYGCGDFLSDYEGIASASTIDDHSMYRDDVSLMYFVDADLFDGKLSALHLVPMRLKKLQVIRAEPDDRDWLLTTMQRECAKYGLDIVDTGGDYGFTLKL